VVQEVAVTGLKNIPDTTMSTILTQRWLLNRRNLLRGLGIYAAAGALLTGARAAEPPVKPKPPAMTAVSPLTPEQALAAFKVEPGMRVELVAAEPLVADPLAIAFDERGRMFVAEGRSYPVEPGGSQPPECSIALLEDTDGDGRYDKRTVFADGLQFVDGLLPWRGGVFATCTSDVLYLKDTDGDGRADVRKVVLTGFGIVATSQHYVNTPLLGLDNWIYLPDGFSGGGHVRCPNHPDRRVVESKTDDWRFRPDTFEFESVSGHGQYGQTFDDSGHRFVCYNRNPLRHVVLQARYLKRNPHLAFSDAMEEVAKSGVEGKVFPISHDTTTASFLPQLIGQAHAGTFTSACGSHLYRGSALPPEHYGNLFVCEPAQNLVQRQILASAGATFTAKIARVGEEFLASTDTWFRPVSATTGPDGALYVCDMYRKVIDHPKFYAAGTYTPDDVVAGKNMGRIYRVTAETRNAQRELRNPNLANTTTKELCAALSDSNGWTRDAARRLLLERADPASVPPLRSIVKSDKNEHARLLALCTLDGLNALEDAQIRRAVGDSSAAVRENAVRLAESRLTKTRVFDAPLLALADDADSHVRFQCALTLGEINDARIISALAKIAARGMADRWTRAAVLSSIGSRADAFLRAFLAIAPKSGEGMPAMMADLGRIFGASQPPEKCLTLIADLTASSNTRDTAWQSGALTGMAEGLRGRGFAKGGRSALANLVAGDSANAKLARERFGAMVERSTTTAQDEHQPVSTRLAALNLLGQSSYATAGGALQKLVATPQPTEIQVAAVRAIGQLGDPAGAKELVARERWRAFMPPVREAVIATLMSQPRLLSPLLDALEAGQVAATNLDPTRRGQLLKHRDEMIRKRAEAIFKDLTGGNRQQVFAEYKAILPLKPDAANGHEIFKKTCAQCHTYAGEGAQVGPDLTGVRNQPPEALLMHILMPSYEIAAGFQAYEIETKDGRTLTGLIASETDASVTLRRALGEQETILRGNIASLSTANLSLMPDELEKTMTKQELRDVIGFLNEGDSGK
jgi:putative membrane-bound dehydrogenase-like protein